MADNVDGIRSLERCAILRLAGEYADDITALKRSEIRIKQAEQILAVSAVIITAAARGQACLIPGSAESE